MPRLWIVWVVVALLLSSRSAEAFELKQAAHGQSVHWAGPTMTFVVDPSVEAAVPGGGAAVASALAAWSGVSGAPQLLWKAGAGGGKAANDGVNTVLLAPEGFAPAGTALAVTVLTFDQDTGEILDADIVVNGVYAFAVLAADARSPDALPFPLEGAPNLAPNAGPFDLFHVLAHETGHALGLGDVTTDDAVMYLYTTPGDASYRAPVSDDEAGIEAIYGARQAGCSASIAGSPAAGEGGGWLVTLALGIAGVRAVRRRGRPFRAALKAGAGAAVGRGETL